MSSTYDSDRPGPAKRRVLRKIDARAAIAAPPPAAPPQQEQVRARTRAAIAPPAPAPPAASSSAHTSVPPVVSTVVTPLATYQDGLPDLRPSSSWRGVVVGATLGLAIVGLFVAGTRLAHRTAATASPPAAAVDIPAPVPASAPLAAQPVVEAPVAPPAIAATMLPTVKPPHPVKAVAAKPGVAKATLAIAPAPPGEASAPAPEDTAPSLVPVIPPAPKPTVDPFVRAVQQDIQEDQSQGR
jgi:hypothetical protein